MKLYTKTGDAGTTGLFGGARVSKGDVRVEAYGAVDELNAALGLAEAHAQSDTVKSELPQIQADLFSICAELASNPDKPLQASLPLIGDGEVGRLERCIDGLEATLTPLTNFILPGGSVPAAHLHLARTICRRAERRVVVLGEASPVRPEAVRYLNRLSDLLFVMARHENHSAGLQDVPWSGR